MTIKFFLRGALKRVPCSAAAVLVTLGVLGSTQALAGIANTKHNLGTSTGPGVNKLTAGTAEICVFCHTPHGADTSAAVPLWNRKIAGTTYTTYNSLGTSSLDGATAPVGSVSVACLSCHDGVTAMSTMINAPGSGGYNASGAALSGATWSGANQTSGVLAAGIITNIGQDLRNDHPVGIQYAGGPATGSTVAVTSATFKDPDFKDITATTLNGQSVWYVDRSGSTTGRDKSDMLLYTRGKTGDTFTGGTTSTLLATTPQPYVECASCHDPHIDNGTTFLRTSNAGSAVCLTCHSK